MRSPGRDTAITDISKLESLLVEGFLVLVFQGLGLCSLIFLFWFLRTRQLILSIPDSSQLCWSPHAFPFLEPGFNISTPNAFPFSKLCSSLGLVQKNHSLLSSTTQRMQHSLSSGEAGKHRASVNVPFVSMLGKNSKEQNTSVVKQGLLESCQ